MIDPEGLAKTVLHGSSERVHFLQGREADRHMGLSRQTLLVGPPDMHMMHVSTPSKASMARTMPGRSKSFGALSIRMLIVLEARAEMLTQLVQHCTAFQQFEPPRAAA